MFSHVTLGSADLARAIIHYDAVLLPLGFTRHETNLEHGLVGYCLDPMATPQLYIMRPIDGRPASIGNGVTVAFEAPDRQSVRDTHARALTAGGHDEGAPGLRAHYHPDFYGAYWRDLDGNKLCIVCHRPGD